jgi:hypothetical protein
MRCFSCGRDVVLRAGERVGFRDACPCGSDLHVCRNCAHPDPSAYNECRESNAERVGDRERANRCDYFAPGSPASGPVSGPTASSPQGSRAALENLFKKRP